MSWNAHVARLVAFPLPGQVRDANDMWGRAFGSSTLQTFMQLPNLPGGSQAVGKIDGETVVLLSQFGRTEFTSTPITPQPPMNTANSPPAFDNLQVALDRVLTGALKALEAVPINRLAIVLEAAIGAVSAEEAAEAIRTELGLDDDWRGATDFVFQLNRRKTLAAGSEMNRVARWAMGVNQIIKLEMNGPSVSPVTVTAAPMRTLTLDLNTAPGTGSPIQPAEVEPILKELADEAVSLLDDPHGRLRHP